MKRKVLIGSIISVAILISVSFVSVVGYQSVKVNENESSSPLFAFRTKRAIEKVSENKFISNFLGKGKESSISFPDQGFFTIEMLKQISLKITKGDLEEVDGKSHEKLNVILEIARNNLVLVNKIFMEKMDILRPTLMELLKLDKTELQAELREQLNYFNFNKKDMAVNISLDETVFPNCITFSAGPIECLLQLIFVLITNIGTGFYIALFISAIVIGWVINAAYTILPIPFLGGILCYWRPPTAVDPCSVKICTAYTDPCK
jgi:hypothetical protein